MSRSVEGICAIMAGGSGTRFWPLSRFDRPKQLLALGGDGRSLLRVAYDRARSLFAPERVLIVTAERLADAAAAEVPEIPRSQILGEPVPRNTAPCLAWAAARAARDLGDVPVTAVPSDHWIEGDDAYADAMARAAALAGDGWIATFGIPPDRPETGYGYLRAGTDLGGGAFAVASFIEKPDAARARSLAAQADVYWNSGMFVFSAGRMLAELDARLPETARFAREIERSPAGREAALVAERFGSCEATSIDYGVMERAERVAVVVAGFRWSDIGSWDAAAALAEAAAATEKGPGGPTVLTEGAARTFVRSDVPSRRVVAVVGADDLIVVDTADALLVCRRGESQSVRAVVDELRRRGLGDLL